MKRKSTENLEGMSKSKRDWNKSSSSSSEDDAGEGLQLEVGDGDKFDESMEDLEEDSKGPKKKEVMPSTAERMGSRPAAYDESLDEISSAKPSTTTSHLTLKQRLNRRSAPPVSSSPKASSASRTPSGTFSKRRPPLPPPSDYIIPSYSDQKVDELMNRGSSRAVGQNRIAEIPPVASRVPLSQRLGNRSRDTVPAFSIPSTPPRPSPVDPNRTPERPSSPSAVFDDEEVQVTAGSNQNQEHGSFISSPSFRSQSPTFSAGHDSSFGEDLNSNSANDNDFSDEGDDKDQIQPMPQQFEAVSGQMADQLGAMQDNDEEEPMDWCDLDENLYKCRQTAVDNTFDENDNFLSLSQFNELVPGPNEKVLYVVVDTNIFIHQLLQLKKLLAPELSDHVIAYVPRIVIVELETLIKSQDQALQMKARKANDFLLQALQSQTTNIMCQTLAERKAASKLSEEANNDDRILQACLALRNEEKTVILYTNDKNLSVKSEIEKIKSFSSSRLFPQGLQSSLESVMILNDPKMLGPVTEEERVALKQVFNEIWLYMSQFTKIYSNALKIEIKYDYQNANDQIGEFPVVTNIVACRNHLESLAMLSDKLMKQIEKTLNIDPNSLSLSNKELLNFHQTIQNFFFALEIPLEIPIETPNLSEVRPMTLMEFLKNVEDRELLLNAYEKVKSFRKNLFDCRIKVFREFI